MQSEETNQTSKKQPTPVGVRELGAAEETQVACPRPHGLRVSEAEPGVEVVGLEHLLAITAVVAAAVVSTVHPNLQEEEEEEPQAFRKRQRKQKVKEKEKFYLSQVRVSQRPLGLRVGDDDANAW